MAQCAPEPLEGLMPERLREKCEALSCLKESRQRQTLLLREKGSGELAVLKRVRDGEEDTAEEAQLLEELAGEGVPVGYGSFREGEWAYLLREYVPGETLLDYSQKRGALPTEEVREAGLQLCRILKRLHGQDPPVIHRDVKLENVIRTPEGKLVLIDFGIARRYEGGAPRDTRVLGTPSSAPPEQFGYRQTDARSDVYALGVLLRELASGDTAADAKIPDWRLRAVASRCTSFDPKGRYPDAAALERALERLNPRRRRIWWVAAVCVAMLAACCGFFLRSRPVQPGDVYRFSSPEIEAEVCRLLGKEPGTVTWGDLDGIENLLLCGEKAFSQWGQLVTYGQEAQLDYTPEASRGTVDTLADIAHMKNLRTLAVCSQEIEDLSPLAGSGVERLALHGNRISDVTALGQCPGLRELIISGNPVSDLSPLAGCGSLWFLNAGGTALEDLDSLAGQPSLNTLHLHDCERLTDISALGSLPSLGAFFLRPVSADALEVIRGLERLDALGMWQVEGLEDLTPLTVLAGLRYLFLDTLGLKSLAGLEQLTQLDTLDVRSPEALDIAPVGNLALLSRFTVVGLDATDWAPLRTLPALEQVWCRGEQEDALRKILEGGAVELHPVS